MDTPDDQRLVSTDNVSTALTQLRAAIQSESSEEIHRLQQDNEKLHRTLKAKAIEIDELRRANRWLQIQLQVAPAASVEGKSKSQEEEAQIPATQIVDGRPVQFAKSYDQLLLDNLCKEAQIDALTTKFRVEKEKVNKWRLKHQISSSPTTTSPLRIPLSGCHCSDPPSRRSSPGVRSDKQQLAECKRISASPEPEGAIKRRSQEIKIEPLFEISGNSQKKRKTSSDRGAEAIPSIAEDGEDHSRTSSNTSTTNIKTRSSSPTALSAHRRLGNLLTEPTLPKPILSRGDSFKKISKNSTTPSLPPNKPHFLPPHDRRKPVFRPEDLEPFRSLPLHRLALTHFKVNAAANDGFEYAYQDVVRGKDQRKCLPGYTKPECCGNKFRALARTLQTTNGDHESTEDRITNNELLLDFLGPGSEERIRTMTALARSNLIEEARTKICAERYGKMHRTAHERAQSPPGFWDAEMPGTQEAEKNRQRAKAMEREEIERRFGEAMKEGGRWMFADE